MAKIRSTPFNESVSESVNHLVMTKIHSTLIQERFICSCLRLASKSVKESWLRFDVLSYSRPVFWMSESFYCNWYDRRLETALTAVVFLCWCSIKHCCVQKSQCDSYSSRNQVNQSRSIHNGVKSITMRHGNIYTAHIKLTACACSE